MPTSENRTSTSTLNNARASPLPAPPVEAEAAYHRVLPAIEAVPLDEARRINVHVPTAVTTVLGALPSLLALRDEIATLPKNGAKASTLPKHAVDALAMLRDLALATAFAYLATAAHAESETALRARLAEGTPLRDRLLVAAEALAHAGYFDATHVATIRSGTGHLDTASDLIGLGALFRAHWDEVSNKTAVTRADVDRAAELGSVLLEALGQRKLGTDGAGGIGKPDLILRKAFALLSGVYGDCRRAVVYLRWYEGDADLIAPSLFQRR
ncbi:MAG TPA: hypothetical protein VFS43_08240, partial [Polyangiaceae bacterium]|nr:hypothetical protein [Polyangiaceae bacterium]